ncbi:TerF-like protein [Virgisporangium aliadipatigenens]|uniref:TerF-like protein n=1 Tax=Virgisporangium aliadipatigenens TaxID=741659 RepID=A0A8J3YUB4_9ACTN|nr:TerD family protein [Virgisporangium aliadipatigenens]GIJ49941.1 TerF-like protein [Virgisporangium aliadipatigenens]
MLGTVLRRGANVVVSERLLTVEVSWRAGTAVDPCAFLVTPDGKVRDDNDFVFYNNPEHGSGAVVLAADTTGTATLTVDLNRIDAGLDRIVIGGSVDGGTFATIPGLHLAVNGAAGSLATFPLEEIEPVTAIVFGELYRRGTEWKFRAVGQGWDSGLAGLVTTFGIAIEEDDPEPSPATPAPRPDWHRAPDDPATLRWWSGTEWTSHSVPVRADTPHQCGRCGGPKRPSPYSHTLLICAPCESETTHVLNIWRGKVAELLATSGPTGPAWDQLWTDLRFYRVREDNGRAAMRPIALQHLQQLVTFAFADDLIEQHEVDGFEEVVRQLGIRDPAVDHMRARLQRGLALAAISNGDVPNIDETTLTLDTDEILHLDASAVHVRYLASGPRRNSGRLIASNRKLRFVGTSGGSELAWVKVLEVRPEYGSVVLTATGKGSGSYEVDDPEYISAVLSGALKVAKRQAAIPAQRDSRSIPSHVKAAVWRRDGGACVECQATEYLEFDHEIPWSRGGATSVNNLRLLCRRCNLAKGARI